MERFHDDEELSLYFHGGVLASRRIVGINHLGRFKDVVIDLRASPINSHAREDGEDGLSCGPREATERGRFPIQRHDAVTCMISFRLNIGKNGLHEALIQSICDGSPERHGMTHFLRPTRTSTRGIFHLGNDGKEHQIILETDPKHGAVSSKERNGISIDRQNSIFVV